MVINAETCGSGSAGDHRFEALLGFFRGTGNPVAEKLVTGSGICSIRDHSNIRAEIRGSTEKRTVEVIDCRQKGYVELIGTDEKPECVTGATRLCPVGEIYDYALTPPRCRPLQPGETDNAARDTERVAAHSVPPTVGCDVFKRVYTLKRRITAGGDGGTATYATRADCHVWRHKGIHAFKGFDEYWTGMRESLVAFNNAVGTVRGPKGPQGEPGSNNGPQGPRGPRGRTCRSPCPTPTP